MVGLLVNGSPAPAATEGDEVELILDRTPFYAEGGGQLADHGRIRLDSGAVVEVRDVQQPVPGVIVHSGGVLFGEVVLGAAAYATIDADRRRAVSRAHSATHLTHQALRDALGPTAAQAGSENAPGRFRFDFGSPSAVPGSVLTDVEQKINEVLTRELDVTAEVMTMDEARKQGAIAMFGEKYGDQVRVVTIGDFSKELCGGTHVGNTAQLGLVKLLGESSIGSGVRRVEALVGVDAYKFLAREHTVVSQLTELVKGRPEELPEKISGMLAKLKDAEKEIEKFRAEKVLAAAAGLADAAEDVRGVALVAAQVADGTGADELRKLVLDIRGGWARARPWSPRSPWRTTARSPSSPPTRTPGPAASRPASWSAPRPRRSAAAVAARTTSPRAVAPTRPPSARRSRPCGPWSRSAPADGGAGAGLPARAADRRRRR